MKRNASLNFSDTLLNATKLTQGRIDQRQVFCDFLAYCACELSNRTDPVHLAERKRHQESIAKSYTSQELESFMNTFRQLAAEIVKNVDLGEYTDLLGFVHQQLHPKSGPLKQDFTPPDIGKLMSRIALQGAELPEEGYFTCNEPTCGSGVLCLEFAENLLRQGYNPCEQLVIQASDLDSQCVHMTYLQLSLYGIPAVIIRGNAISLKEYDRWYTPLYIWRKWVWRQPMPFSTGRNKSDELLKMASEPLYAAVRYIKSFQNQEEGAGCE